MSSAPMNDDDALLVADNADTGFSNHLAALKKLAEVVRRQHAEVEQLKTRLASAEAMAGCMDMLRGDLERMEVIPRGTAPMFMTEAVLGAMVKANRNMLDRCALIARNGCLVPPDGGSPTEDERLLCQEIERRIREVAA